MGAPEQEQQEADIGAVVVLQAQQGGGDASAPVDVEREGPEVGSGQFLKIRTALLVSASGRVMAAASAAVLLRTRLNAL